MSKVITLENLEVFKQECDKAYASKEEIITATVDCSHKYEITGNTGDEHGLAIDDQQMLIKKIQGHSRRKSLNLISFKPGTYAGVTLTYDNASGIYTFNGTSTGFSIPLKASLPQGTKVSFIAEAVSGTKTGAQNDISVMIDGTWIATDWVNTKTLSESISGCWMSTDITYTNYKVKINVVEGTFTNETMPLFQPYDNTLVNSNNQLISTGRNILNPDEFGAKCQDYNKVTGIAKIYASRENDSKILMPDYYFAPNTQYTFIFKGKNGYNDANNENDGPTNLVIRYTNGTLTQMFFKTVDTDTTLKITSTKGLTISSLSILNQASTTTLYLNECAIIKGANQDFEPYKQDTIQAPSLGEFDYYQEGKIYRQTSQVITLNGSESFREITSQALPKTKLFAYNTGLQMTGDSIVSNSKYGNAYAGIWAVDNVSIGNSENEIFIRDNFTTIDQLKQWLSQNPIQLVYKLATPTIINDGPIPNGMAVYNGGLQIQQGDVPYTITKQYNLSQKAQILANIEVDREQAKMIDEVNNKIINLPSPSITNRTVKNISINNTFPQTLTPEQTKDVFNNDLFVILSVGGSQNFYEYKNVIENPSEGKTFINISPGMKDYASENVSFDVLYVESNGYIRKESFQINKFPVYQHSILITDEKDTRILCSIVAKKGRTISSIPDLKYLIKASGLKVVCNGFVNDKSKFHKGMAFELNTQSGDVKVKYVDLNNNSNLIYDVELNSISNLKIIDTVYDYTEANG